MKQKNIQDCSTLFKIAKKHKPEILQMSINNRRNSDKCLNIEYYTVMKTKDHTQPYGWIPKTQGEEDVEHKTYLILLNKA